MSFWIRPLTLLWNLNISEHTTVYCQYTVTILSVSPICRCDGRDAKSWSNMVCVQCTPLVMSMKRCCSATSFTRSPWDHRTGVQQGIHANICQSTWFLCHSMSFWIMSANIDQFNFTGTGLCFWDSLMGLLLQWRSSRNFQSAHPPIIIWVTPKRAHLPCVIICYYPGPLGDWGTLSVYNLLRHPPCSHLNTSTAQSPNWAKQNHFLSTSEMTQNWVKKITWKPHWLADLRTLSRFKDAAISSGFCISVAWWHQFPAIFERLQQCLGHNLQLRTT